MANDWIVDVLGDLRQFAESNGLPKLQSCLEMAADVAELEIAGSKGVRPITGHIDGEARQAHRAVGGRANA